MSIGEVATVCSLAVPPQHYLVIGPDNLGLARQLGAAPPEGSVGEKIGMGLQRLMARWMRKKNHGQVSEPRQPTARLSARPPGHTFKQSELSGPETPPSPKRKRRLD